MGVTFCSQLSNEFSDEYHLAAKMLADQHPSRSFLGVIDAVENKASSIKYKISNFPTLFFFV